MRGQIRGLNAARRNAQDGISICQIADGALNEVSSMLLRARQLSIQSANDTYTKQERLALNEEVAQLIKEVDSVARNTNFNTRILLNGNKAANLSATSTTLPKFIIGSGGVIFYFETLEKSVGTTTQSGSDYIKSQLRDVILPNAVDAILERFPKTFSYLEGPQIGIGLDLYDSGTSVAGAIYAHLNPDDTMIYSLRVNMRNVDLSDDIKRKQFERTLSHEMMHAMMSEALTNGMVGYALEQYPKWFKEGTAQLLSGAFEKTPTI